MYSIQFPPSLMGYWRHCSLCQYAWFSLLALPSIVLMYLTPAIMVEEAPTSFSPFSLTDCMLLSHFYFNDFVAVAFPDLARNPDTQIQISDMTSLLSRQQLLSTLLLIVSPFSHPSILSYKGTFLVHLPIVLSLRKIPIGLYINLHMYLSSPQLVLHFTCSVVQSLLLDSLCDLSLTSFLSQGCPPRRSLWTCCLTQVSLTSHLRTITPEYQQELYVSSHYT